MLKKNICKILCVLCIAALLAACGKQPPASTLDTLPSTQPTTEETTLPEATGDEAAATDETTDSTELSGVVDVMVNDNQFALGRIQGGVYTNTYAGVGCKLDENWQFYSAQELQELPGDAQEALSDTEIRDLLSRYTQIVDMKAENVAKMQTVNLLYTQLPMSERLLYATMDDDALIDNMLLEQKDLLISSYESAGYQVGTIEKKQVTFLGAQTAALYMEATYQGTAVYFLQVFDYTLGQYGVTITCVSYGENATEAILANFYAI